MAAETGRSGSAVEDVLAEIGLRGKFAVRLILPPENLCVEVAGVGRIDLPIPKAKAAALCRAARPARHGLKDQTVLDANVRDTWEITKGKIRIDQRSWMKALRAALARIAQELGLGPGAGLRASLHNMLVYAPGQFFLPHQDSEKSDDMVGTLVVTLPSEFSGGEIVVQHHEEKISFRGSGKELSLIAFYADCHHEVRPIKSGHRVVLTYNLLLARDRDASLVSVAPELVDALEVAARDFFRNAPAPAWAGSEAREAPDRLVYLLDHQYSQRGLGWTGLKNADGARAAALREVASRLDCEIALALADVHESWMCEEEYDDDGYGHYGRRGSYGYDDDDDDDAESDGADASTPELVELIDATVELRHVVDERGKRERVASRVEPDELRFTKPSVDLDPFQSEHEGYMGNWGNTVDRWYHRAAVVLWPRSRAFVIRAKASARWAISQIEGVQRRKQLAEARDLAAQLVAFWSRIVRTDEATSLAGRTLRVCRALNDRALAAALIHPLRVENLTAKTAPALVAVIEQYGLPWFEDVCAAFFGSETDERYYPSERTPLERRLSWQRGLAAFVRVICEAASDNARNLACRIVEEQWVWLQEQCQRALRASPSGVLGALERLEVATLAVIESSVTSEAMWLHTEVFVFLATGACPPRALVHLLRTAESRYTAEQLEAFGLDLVHDRVTEALGEAVRGPERARDDWSITPPGGCACALCKELGRFLVDRTRTRFEWPLAKEKRAHVHRTITASELPVTHTTRRSGRPYTLVLAKTPALFEREAKERAAWQEGLAWLARAKDAFMPLSGKTSRASPARVGIEAKISRGGPETAT